MADTLNTTFLDSQKTIIFKKYPFGYIDIKNPNIHYDESFLISYISSNTNKHFYLDDLNTKLNVVNNALVATQNKARKFIINSILVLCSLIIVAGVVCAFVFACNSGDGDIPVVE
jgi:hypothetical protein